MKVTSTQGWREEVAGAIEVRHDLGNNRRIWVRVRDGSESQGPPLHILFYYLPTEPAFVPGASDDEWHREVSDMEQESQAVLREGSKVIIMGDANAQPLSLAGPPN